MTMPQMSTTLANPANRAEFWLVAVDGSAVWRSADEDMVWCKSRKDRRPRSTAGSWALGAEYERPARRIARPRRPCGWEDRREKEGRETGEH